MGREERFRPEPGAANMEQAVPGVAQGGQM